MFCWHGEVTIHIMDRRHRAGTDQAKYSSGETLSDMMETLLVSELEVATERDEFDFGGP